MNEKASLLIQAGTQRGSLLAQNCGTSFLQRAESLKPYPIGEGLRKLGEHVYHPVVNHVICVREKKKHFAFESPAS